MKRMGKIPIEISFTSGVLGVTWLIGRAIGVSIQLPSGDRAPFIDLHYIFPLISVTIIAYTLLQHLWVGLAMVSVEDDSPLSKPQMRTGSMFASR